MELWDVSKPVSRPGVGDSACSDLRSVCSDALTDNDPLLMPLVSHYANLETLLAVIAREYASATGPFDLLSGQSTEA